MLAGENVLMSAWQDRCACESLHRQINRLPCIPVNDVAAGATYHRISRKDPFDDPEWLFELKYDGFRPLLCLEQGIRWRGIDAPNRSIGTPIRCRPTSPASAAREGRGAMRQDADLVRELLLRSSHSTSARGRASSSTPRRPSCRLTATIEIRWKSTLAG
jgi:hypothetical protein